MNELTVPTNWEAMKEQAAMLVKSGFLPQSIRTPEQAIAVAITSKELGIGMMEGFRSINVIQGKPTISPQLMLALANRSGQLENIKIDSNDQRAIITVTRKGREPHTEEFGIKEATGLGLIGRDNYKKQPSVMFKWRALAANLRVTFPDVMIGFYTPEEMGAEVKIGEGETMEVIETEEYDTGVRVPAGYWDLPEDQKQERLGKGFYPKKTPKGWFIYTKEKPSEDWLEKAKAIEAQEAIVNESQETPKNGLLSPEEIKEVTRLTKQKNVDLEAFKAFVKGDLGVSGIKSIKKGDFDKVVEWLIKNERDAING